MGYSNKKGASPKSKQKSTNKSKSFSKTKNSKTSFKSQKPTGGRPPFGNKAQKSKEPLPSFSNEVRLNKFLSNAGICSRREADVLIETGVVSINGKIVTEMGYKVKPGDKVQYDGETINAETKRYVLLNKPKDFITTMDDPWGRKTVMGLVMKACKERVYPVGRLDRDTTGLLLFTNDGDLAKKLTHPRHKASKIYHVHTDKPVSVEHIKQIEMGIHLEDGEIKADNISYVEGKTSRDVGIEIHSGKNRIVRRIFEHLGYTVVKLDRVKFHSLTKKDLPRGKYRHLTEQEVAFLKMS